MNIKFSLILLFFASLSTTNAYAVLSTGTCDGQRISYANDDASATTFSQTFVNLPGMARTITIPGTTSTCVAINFSFLASIPFYEGRTYVRATRDGVQCLNVADFEVGPSVTPPEFNTYSANFICPGVTPGNHTFRIQWMTFVGDTIRSLNRTMILHHR